MPPVRANLPTPTRTNRTRTESMALLEEATLDLLIDRMPESLTVREIAEVAGVHYRYIPDYFGGKAELFAAIYPRIAQEAADVLQFPFAAAITNGVDPKLVRQARLAIWMSANHPKGVPASARPLQQQLGQILKTQFNVDDTTAKLVSERLIALVTVFAAYPDVVSPEPIDVQAHIELEIKMLISLAAKNS